MSSELKSLCVEEECVFTGGLEAFKGDSGRLEALVLRTMNSSQKIIQVISAIQSEITKLELENLDLRRRAGAHLRKTATVPNVIPECRGRNS